MQRHAARLLASLPPSVREALVRDLDPNDPDERDPAFISEYALPFLDFFRRVYFRSTVEGLEHAPKAGPFLAISNHSGGPILADCWVMLSYWWSLFGVDQPGYAMVHDAAFRIPVLRNLLIKLGALRASRANAEKVLDRSGIVLIFPGGELDCLRSFSRRNKVDFYGRTGFLELALEREVPIVPVVNVGGHEVYFTLFSSQILARWTGLTALTRVKTLPVNIGLPWGIWPTGFLPFIPLPAKFEYKVGKAIELRRTRSGRPHPSHDAAVIRRGYREVTNSMQGMLNDLAARRRLPLFG
jgi:1-acyl-sn-glycerol-3-phosphate acyltransferase